MSNPTAGGLAAFIAELKRRHVFRTLIGYGAVAFVVLQAAEIVLPAFAVGDWVLQLVVVLAVLGLPIVLAFAWVYEITPRGIRTMKELDLEAGRRLEEEASLVPRLALLAVIVLAAGTAGAYWVRTAVPLAEAGTTTDPAGASASPAFRAAGDAASDVPIRSLAVLPLGSSANPSAGEPGAAEGDYFAAGMHEAIVSRLGRLGGSFRVISRTTVQQYDPTGRSVTQIGQELGVEGIVEGSVVLDGGRVRITVQLVHAPSDRQLWSAEYERELGNVIALQREVAEAIAREIMGELEADPIGGGTTTVAAASAPEADPEAAVAEMKGRVALAGAAEGDGHGLVEAGRHFEAALREDSTYAPALVGLAGSTLMRELTVGAPPSPETLERVGHQMERALELDPGSEEARDILALVRRIERRPVRTDLGARLAALSGVAAERVNATAVRLDAARGLISVGRMAEAERLLRKSLKGAPAHVETRDELEHVVVISNRLQEAVELRRERTDAVPDAVAVEGAPDLEELAEAVERRGARGWWEWRLAEITALERAGREVPPLSKARVLAALGRGDEAFAALRAAADAPGAGAAATRPAASPAALATLRSDPVWDPYRRDPRFRSVLEEALSGEPSS